MGLSGTTSLWRRILGVSVLGFAFVLAGCSADDSVDTTTETTSQDSVPDDEEPEGDEPTGTLSVAMVTSVNSLDPLMVNPGGPVPMMLPIFDRLVHLTSEGDIIDGLSVEQNYLNDGDTLEFVLREGVLFHDGTTMDAEAVKFNFERIDSLEGPDQIHVLALAPIAEIEVIDELRVHIHRDPDPAFDLDWSLLLKRLTENPGMMVSPEASAAADFDQNPVGAGPFYVESNTAEELVLRRFADHWDPEAAGVAEIVMAKSPSPDNVNAGLQAGNYDIAVISAAAKENIEALPDVDVLVAPVDRVVWFTMNTSRPPLDDLDFRLALQYGIDREGFAEVFSFNASATSQPFATSSIGYNPACEDRFPLSGDPELAAEHLAASPYADDPVVQLMIVNLPIDTEKAELLKDQYSRIGIEIDIQVVEQDQFGRWYDGEFDMGLGFRGRLDPLQTLTDSWSINGGTNPGGFLDPEIEAELTATAAETDPEERIRRIQDLSCAIQETAVHLSIHDDTLLWAVNDRVQGFNPPVHPLFDFRGVTISD